MSVNKVQTDGTLSPIATRGQFIQYSAMPTANADRVNQIIQYIGDTTTDYTNGYFYKCVLNGSSYEWNNVDVQFNDDNNKLSYADNSILGAKNRWNFPAWKNVGKSDATATWDDATYTLTLTATANYGRTNITVPDEAQISVVPNERIKFVWDSTGSDRDTTITFDVFKIGDTSSVFATASIHDNELLMTVPANCYKLTYRVMINSSGKVAKLANCMCILASDTDSTYAPYTETNYQLTKNKVDWESNSVLGAKNFIKVTKPTQTFNDVTFTVNSDGTVTVSTEATGATTNTYFLLDDQFKIPSGDYILNGCPSEGSWGSSSLKYAIKFRRNPTGGYDVNEIGNGLNIAITDSMANDYYQIYICIGSGQILNNLTFKPMLRLATDTDSIFQPYSLTNQQITNLLNW